MPDTRTSLFVVVITLLITFPIHVIHVTNLGTESTIHAMGKTVGFLQKTSLSLQAKAYRINN